MHINGPLNTLSWHTCVKGYKLWVVIPPSDIIDKEFIRGHHLMNEKERDDPIHYFHYLLPRLKE